MSEVRSALTELLRKPKPAEWGDRHVLWVHDNNVTTNELVLNPTLFPEVQVGDCVALVRPSGGRVFLLVSSVEQGPFKQSSFEVN